MSSLKVLELGNALLPPWCSVAACVGRNALSGSSSANFSNWILLETLSIFENFELRWDLNLLSAWPQLKYAVMQV